MKVIKFLAFLLFGAFFVFSVGLDFLFGIYTNWMFQLTMTIVLVSLLMGVQSVNQTSTKWVSVGLGIVFMLSIRYWDYNTLKPFLRAFQRLDKGMTKQEVISRMGGFTLAGKGKGFVFQSEKSAKPELDKQVEFLNFTHTEEGWGDSDWGLVYFVNDHLYETAFSPD